MDKLRERVAWVTGSSRGIGAAIARALAREGAAIAVHGRDETAANQVAANIRDLGVPAMVVLGDVTSPDDLARMVREIEGALGPIDILVANAGGNPVPSASLENISIDQWHAAVDANLTSTYATLSAVLPAMKSRGVGSIVTMSSAAARRPTAQSPVAYAAAKAGVEVLTRWVAAEAGPTGVRINCVAPETIMTDRNRAIIPAEIQNELVEAHPIRRLGTPEDVAAVTAFLVSDDAAWISGVTVDVAGGTVLR